MMNGSARMDEQWQPLTDLPTPLSAGGRTWKVRIEGMQRDDGTWAGRIVFADGAGRRVTDRETSQPNREALEYWATGLEAIYLEGALSRAR
jgi:hypothetical protein